MIRRGKSNTGFGKRGREAKVPERSPSSIERLKAAGTRWWTENSEAKAKPSARPSAPPAKSRS
jgi:hypothetical protein